VAKLNVFLFLLALDYLHTLISFSSFLRMVFTPFPEETEAVADFKLLPLNCGGT